MLLKYKEPYRLISYILIIVGLVSFFLGITTLNSNIWHALLINSYFFIAVSLGAMLFISLQCITQARWALDIIEIAKAIPRYLMIGAPIMMAILIFGGKHIYSWLDTPLPYVSPSKAFYFNTNLFIIRAAAYFILWILFANYFRKADFINNIDKGNTYSIKNKRISIAFIITMIVTSSLASWDWLMAIQITAYSSIFNWLCMTSMMISGIAFISIIFVFQNFRKTLPNISTKHHRNIAKYLLGFGLLWVYFWFFQYITIWYANIPFETPMISYLSKHKILFSIILLMHFTPIIIILNKKSQKSLILLAIISFLIAFSQWIYIYLIIMPIDSTASLRIPIISIGILIGFIGIFMNSSLIRIIK